MNVFVKAHCAVLAAAAMLTATSSSSPAMTGSAITRATTAESTAIVKIHDRWRDDDQGDRHWRRDHRLQRVEAPYTQVETGHHVEVDAPFAHVAVGRDGRHVVAPFVDLWLPR